MFIIILQVIGWLFFALSTILLGLCIRIKPTKRNAERTSRFLHCLFWIVVAPPIGLGVFYPGLTHYDRELGLNPLPDHPIVIMIGILGLLSGTYLFIVSNVSLLSFGKGASGVFLTKQLVTGDVYERMRNPMSLGFYLGSIGLGMVIKSTFMTLGSLLIVKPVHIFYLKYFEEYELELRMGQAYLEYKKRVPFLFPKVRSTH